MSAPFSKHLFFCNQRTRVWIFADFFFLNDNLQWEQICATLSRGMKLFRNFRNVCAGSLLGEISINNSWSMLHRIATPSLAKCCKCVRVNVNFLKLARFTHVQWQDDNIHLNIKNQALKLCNLHEFKSMKIALLPIYQSICTDDHIIFIKKFFFRLPRLKFLQILTWTETTSVLSSNI